MSLLLFIGSTSISGQQTITKTIGGTVTYSNGTPAARVPVILRIGTAPVSPAVITYKLLVTDDGGYFSSTETIYCGYPAVHSKAANVLLDDGTLSPGTGGGGGGPNCGDTGDWSNSLSFNLASSAKNNPQNAGDFCPSVGGPVNVTNGNMWLKQTDYALPGIGENIEITRTYNSMKQIAGIFGYGWASQYDENLVLFNSLYIRITMPNGQIIYFGFAGSGINQYKPITPDFYGYVVKNADNTYNLNFKDGRVHKFNSNGKLIWQKDRNGNQTTLTYTSNKLTGITDAFGRTLTVVSNTNGTIQSISDSLGTIAAYSYETSTTRLKTVTYNDGSKYKFEYINIGGKFYLTTVKDALDNILETHEYDAQGRATTSEKHGGVEKYTLDYTHTDDLTNPYTEVTSYQTTGGTPIVTKYTFDKSNGKNAVTKIEGNCGCGSGSEITDFEYDGKLNLTKKTDALGRQTTYTYDANGNPLTMTDIWGTSVFTYNSFGQILTYKDRMNDTWTNTYDANGNLLTTKDPLNNITTVEYPATNNKGLPDSIEDARQNVTNFTWFANSGLLQEIEDANGKTTTFTYDARGRTKTVTNALNHITTYNYFDDTQRKIELVYPNADKITYKYDIRRLLENVTDERGKITAYEFDPAYRLTKITDPLSHSREFGYDLMSNPVWQKDALGNQTDYLYDNFDRLKEIQYPLAETGATRLVEKYEYDTVGRIKKFIDTANRETVYAYDDANRTNTVMNAELETTTVKYNQRFQTIEVKDALNQVYNFSYDALGRLLSQTRAGATMSYEYDEVGNRTKRTDYAGRITNYEYDDLNRLTDILYGNPVSLQSAYTYDDISRLKTATNEAGTVTLNYDNRNRIESTTDVFAHTVAYEYELTSTVNQKRLKFDGAMYAVYNFDDADRLTNIVDSNDSTTISFSYDNADRLTSKILPNGVTTTYEYDGMSRLKRLKDASSTATLFDRQYAYNPANQISQITEPAQTRNFGYDNVNRLTSMTDGTANESYSFDTVGNRTASHLSASYTYQSGQFNRLVSTATATYTYDANGNMATKTDSTNSWTFTWDYENRMTNASDGTSAVSYEYDALGRRTKRIEGASATKFIYDGQDVLVDDNAGVLTKYQNGLGIDNKLKISLNGTAKYFLADHLGSTNALTDVSGAILEQTAYDSFGNSATNLSTRYQFTGREFDNFTGLHYYRARFYDAQIGRFISEDPIGFAGGDVNLYGYVTNDPLNKRDPSGLLWDTRTAAETVKNVAPASPILLPLVVAGGKVVVVAGGGFAVGYGIGYYPGQYLASRSWNPYVHGPLNPFAAWNNFWDWMGKPEPKVACEIKPQTSPTPEKKFVMVYHGSIDHYTQIQTFGLVPPVDGSPTYITRDIQLAVASVGPNRYEISQGIAKDPGIVGSRIPQEIFDTAFAPYERPVTAWGVSSTEILLRNPVQYQIFNTYMLR